MHNAIAGENFCKGVFLGNSRMKIAHALCFSGLVMRDGALSWISSPFYPKHFE